MSVKNLEKFKHIIGKVGEVADYTSTISATGDFKKVTKLAAIIESWKKILLIPTRTYMDDPTFGSDLYLYVFKPADGNTSRLIENEIRNKIYKFDSRAKITSVEISWINNRKGFIVNVGVEYEGERGNLDLLVDESLLK